MRQLSVRPLAKAKISQGFPLIRLAVPACSIAAWQAFALDHLDPSETDRSGILVVEEDRGCFLGLAVYRIETDLSLGRSLLVKCLVVHDHFKQGRARVALSLLNGLEKLAQRQGCGCIQFLVAGESSDGGPQWAIEHLLSCGHAMREMRLCSCLPHPADPSPVVASIAR